MVVTMETLTKEGMKEEKGEDEDRNRIIIQEGVVAGSWDQLDMSKRGLLYISRDICLYQQITALFLNENRLRSIPEDIFLSLKNLTILNLANNQLSQLPSSIGHLKQLKELFLQNNCLNELPLELGGLFRIKELSVEDNPIIYPPPDVIQMGISSIISYLRDRMPTGPPPTERKFISYLNPHINVSEKDKFRVLTFNILAQIYATPEHYPNCPSWALNWNFRKQNILKELLAYDCDIICLQEVEAAQFKDFFQPELLKMGYQGIYAPKSRARTMEDWGAVDGCATFFKDSRFSLVEEHLIEYQTLALANHKMFGDDPEIFSRLLTKDNIALVLILQVKDAPEIHHHRNSRHFKPKNLLIANTHIHWNPDYKDVKLIQVYMLIDQLSQITAPNSTWHKIPMVLTGDFNSPVNSGPYNFLNTGVLPPNHSDLTPFHYGPCSDYGIQHLFELTSAYEPIGEPPFTNYTLNFIGNLDYIWYTYDSLGVSKVLQPIEEEGIKNIFLPNAFMPSDHISLLSEFYFKRK